jgi:hypothetical protein
MQRDGDTVGRDVDPLDQQPQYARLLGRVEFVPHRLESAEVEQILTPALARQKHGGAGQTGFGRPAFGLWSPDRRAILGRRSLCSGE